MKPFRKYLLTLLTYAIIGLFIAVPIGLILGIAFWKAVVLCVATVISMLFVNIMGIWLNKEHYERTV